MRLVESVVERALAVQELYQKHKEEGITDLYIHRKYIYPQFKISLRTMQRYINRNAKRDKRLFLNQRKKNMGL